MVKLSLSGNTIYLQLLSIKGCDAIRRGLNCFYFDDNFRRIAQWVLTLPGGLFFTSHNQRLYSFSVSVKSYMTFDI